MFQERDNNQHKVLSHIGKFIEKKSNFRKMFKYINLNLRLKMVKAMNHRFN